MIQVIQTSDTFAAESMRRLLHQLIFDRVKIPVNQNFFQDYYIVYNFFVKGMISYHFDWLIFNAVLLRKKINVGFIFQICSNTFN